MFRALIALIGIGWILLGFVLWLSGAFLIVIGIKDGTWDLGIINFVVGWIMCWFGGKMYEVS